MSAIFLDNSVQCCIQIMQEHLVRIPAPRLMGVARWQTEPVDSFDHREGDALRRLCLQRGLPEKQSHAKLGL